AGVGSFSRAAQGGGGVWIETPYRCRKAGCDRTYARCERRAGRGGGDSGGGRKLADQDGDGCGASGRPCAAVCADPTWGDGDRSGGDLHGREVSDWVVQRVGRDSG